MQISQRKKEYVREWLYFFTLGGVLLTILLTFMDVRAAKIVFYWTFYFSLAGILRFYNEYDRSRLWLLALLLLPGLTKVIWFYWEYTGSPHFNLYNDYLNGGKRLLLACVIGYWLFSQMDKFQCKTACVIRYGLLLTFVAVTVFGLYQYAHGAQRVAFALDRATLSAYGYAMLSMMVLLMLATEKHTGVAITLCLAVFLLSWFVLLQTGTRNMMAAYPPIIVAVGVLQFRHFGWKTLCVVSGALLVVVALTYKPLIKPRIDATISEYTLYANAQGNAFGSLTTRLAMWKVGVYCLRNQPLGMSSEARTACFQDYVQTRRQDNVALMYESVHLHNELLDTASLQGIQGATVLLLFYVALIIYALRQRNALLLAAMLILVVSGLTDVIFISRELTVCVALMIIVAEIRHAVQRKVPEAVAQRHG